MGISFVRRSKRQAGCYTLDTQHLLRETGDETVELVPEITNILFYFPQCLCDVRIYCCGLVIELGIRQYALVLRLNKLRIFEPDYDPLQTCTYINIITVSIGWDFKRSKCMRECSFGRVPAAQIEVH
jgi:hypothetical protein